MTIVYLVAIFSVPLAFLFAISAAVENIMKGKNK